MKVLASVSRFFQSPRYAVYRKAQRFIKKYEGFSYNFENNGEEKLLNSLSRFSFETIFDVGANVGEWTNTALDKFPNATIHSFELSRETFLTLKKNLDGKTRAKLNNIGLSNEIGEIVYKDYGVNSGINTIIESAGFHDNQRAPTEKTGFLSTGDLYCEENNIDSIDLLKIDVEGAEHLVIEGFKKILENHKIKMIQFEYGYTNADVNFLIKDFYKLLTPLGYLIGPLKPSGVLFMDFDYALNNFNSGPNYVAVLKEQTELIEAAKGNPIRGFPCR